MVKHNIVTQPIAHSLHIYVYVVCNCSKKFFVYAIMYRNLLLACLYRQLCTTCTVEPPNKGHLGTRASVLYSEVRNVLAL